VAAVPAPSAAPIAARPVPSRERNERRANGRETSRRCMVTSLRSLYQAASIANARSHRRGGQPAIPDVATVRSLTPFGPLVELVIMDLAFLAPRCHRHAYAFAGVVAAGGMVP